MPEPNREPCTFKDTAGRVWTLEITVATVGRLRRELAFDIGKVLEDSFRLLSDLSMDMERIVCVLACVLDEELKARSIEPEDFGRSFKGKTLEDGLAAFVEAITDFFQGRPVGDVLRGATTKATQITELAIGKALAEINAAIDGVDPATAAEELIRSSANVPASSA